MTSQHAIPARYELLPFQREFVNAFVRSDSAVRQLLIAPPGSGKTTVAVEIVQRLREAGRLTRGLVLCPAALVEQYEHLLSGVVTGAPVLTVDRFRLREWEALAVPDESPFPKSIVVVMSLALARRTDVAALLSKTTWDLLVVDEAHLLFDQRSAPLRQLILSGAAHRSLLITATSSDMPLPLTVSTDWTEDVQLSLRASQEAVRLRTLHVPYTDAETAVFEGVKELAARLASKLYIESAQLLAQVLVQRARSSLFALEQTLLRWRNIVVHGANVPMEDEVGEATTGFSKFEDTSLIVRNGILRTLLALEGVESDSKFELLSQVLETEPLQESKRVVWIISRFAKTAEYLASTLADRGLRVRTITTNMPVIERVAAYEAAEPGEVIVVTLAAVQGLGLGDAQTYVFYEQLVESDRTALMARGKVCVEGVEVVSFEDPPGLAITGRNER